jgi:ATP-dependent protease ClpP protease subunit
MDAKAAIAYGIIDKVIDKNSQGIDKILSNDQWDTAAGLVKSSR